jgi:omega-amidase
MTDIRISTIQTNLFWQSPSANLQALGDKIRSIPVPTDVIVLPELFATGFSMATSELAEEMTGPSIEWMRQLSFEKNAVIAGSLMIQEQGKFFNRLIWMQPDGVMHCYDKRHLFRMANEQYYYTAGESRQIIHWKGWKICPLICYDLRFPVWSRNNYSGEQYDYDCLIYVANWPERRAYAWSSLLTARAIENQAYVIAVNRVGVDGNEIPYSGNSAVIDFKGERISKTEPFGDTTETIELSYTALYEYRKSFPVYLDQDTFDLHP